MAIQQVFVVNSTKEPVRAALQGNVRSELIENPSRRWSAVVSPQADPVQGGDAWAVVVSTRPAVLDLLGGDKLPDGFLMVETCLQPNSPREVAGAGGNNYMETFEGVLLKLPIQNGFIPPTGLGVPLVQPSSGEWAGKYVVKLTVKRATPGTSENMVSVVGHFTD